jgi:hypothetical protein
MVGEDPRASGAPKKPKPPHATESAERDREDATSEEDLHPKDPGAMPLEPQNPVNPEPDPIR